MRLKSTNILSLVLNLQIFFFHRGSFAFASNQKNGILRKPGSWIKDREKLEMAILRSPCPLNSKVHPVVTTTTALIATHCHRQLPPPFLSLSISSKLYNHQQTPQPTTKESAPQKIRIDKSFLDVSEATSDTELWAAACLRVRTFYDFQDQDFGIQVSLRIPTSKPFPLP